MYNKNEKILWFNNYLETARTLLEDQNFRDSSERITKLAGILLHRKMILEDVKAGRYDFRGSPERIFFLREEAEERYYSCMLAFYKGIIWLNGQCKQTTGKSLLNLYLTKDDEENILKVAECLIDHIRNY